MGRYVKQKNKSRTKKVYKTKKSSRAKKIYVSKVSRLNRSVAYRHSYDMGFWVRGLKSTGNYGT